MENERRPNRRVPVRIPVSVYTKDKPKETIDAEILNISLGGAFVHCTKPIGVGREIFLEIHFTETQWLEGTIVELRDELRGLVPQGMVAELSVIRWSRENSAPGFGVEFLSLEPDKERFVSRLVHYFEQLEKAGVKFD